MIYLMKKIFLCSIFLLFGATVFAQATIVCSGTTRKFKVNNTAGSTYNWEVVGSGYVGTITAGQGTNDITINWGTTPVGVYTLKVTETNGSCVGTAVTMSIDLKANPTIAIPDIEVCQGLTKLITATVSPAPAGGSFSWVVPSGFTPLPGNVASITTGIAGTYTVKYTDSNGCVSNEDASLVTVNPLPSAAITYSGSLTFCNGESKVLTAPSTPGLTYVWNKDTTPTGTTNQTFTAIATGDYTVTTKDAKGCEATTNPAIKIKVNLLPIVTVELDGAAEFCEGITRNLTGKPIDPLTNATPTNISSYTFQWKRGLTDVGAAIVYPATVSGDYTITVTDANGCKATSSPNTTIAVRPKPLAVISSVINPANICAGGSITLTVGTGANFNYKWRDAVSTLAAIPLSTSSSYTINTASGASTTITNYLVVVEDATYTTNCTTESLPFKVTVTALPVTSPIQAY